MTVASPSDTAKPRALRSRLLSAARLAKIGATILAERRALRRYRRGRGRGGEPRRLVDRLVALGPAFVKLGQILSTRPDILPLPYVEALSELQEHGPQVPLPAVRRTIEDELGASLGELFLDLESEPVACASLAQVHRARLLDGRPVAVKVQRPDVAKGIRRDLDALGLGLRYAQRLLPSRLARTNLEAFLAEFRRYTLQELDFLSEGKVIERFRANFAGQNAVTFPAVHWTHTTTRVLTTDWVDGLRLWEATNTFDAPTKERLVNVLVDVLLQMFVSDGLFHADLHPGNIFFHPDSTITMLDFGMYGELTAEQQDRLILYWLAVAQRQTRRAFHHFAALTRQLPNANREAFRERFTTLADAFYTSPLQEVSFARVYLEMMQAGYRHGFVFPSQLMLHAKALTTAESIIFTLAPTARFEELSRPYITNAFVSRAASLTLLGRRATQLLPELLVLGESLPRDAIDREWDWTATLDMLARGRETLGSSLQDALSRAGLLQVLFERHIRAAISSTILAEQTADILCQTWDRYYSLEPTVPIQPTVGAVFTTHVAAAMLALHETLTRHGIEAEESYGLIYRIGWDFYTELGEPPLLLAAAFTREPRKRLQLATNLFRTFPFGPPAYQWQDVLTDDGSIAFDCLKCPMAEFFAQHGASELCVQTACRLDFPLAEKWGGRLKRTTTISAGAATCDFRWYPSESSQVSRADAEGPR